MKENNTKKSATALRIDEKALEKCTGGFAARGKGLGSVQKLRFTGFVAVHL